MTPLVLLSGWGCDARLWQPLTAHWPNGMTVTAPDWPGYGDRPGLTDPGNLALLAKAMRDDLPADAVWVGWSLGGLLAAAMLDHLPPPHALVLLGMGARFCHPQGVTSMQLATFRRAFARDPQATHAHFVRWQLQGEADARGAYRRLRELQGAGSRATPATLAAGLDQLAELDNSQRLASPPCRLWRIAGERDALLAPALREAADYRLGEAGHCPMLSQPAALAACLAAIRTGVTP